jgi:hypothetical protein
MANENITKTTIINTLEGWTERRTDLIKFIDELGALTVEQFISNGVRKAGKAQALGVLLHCSAGYVGDKFRGKTTVDEQVAVVGEMIAPELTPEQVKERNYKTAVDALTTLRGQKVPEATIAMVISAMPEGKRALADNK